MSELVTQHANGDPGDYAGLLTASEDALYNMMDDDDFIQACETAGVDPRIGADESAYWTFAQRYARQQAEKGVEPYTDPVTLLTISSPAFLLDQLALDGKSLDAPERALAKARMHQYQDLLHTIGDDLPDMPVSQLTDHLVSTTALLNHSGIAYRQEDIFASQVYGVQRERALAQMCAAQGRQLVKGTLEDDLAGVDYRFVASDGQVVPIDVKTTSLMLDRLRTTAEDELYAIDWEHSRLVVSVPIPARIFRDRLNLPPQAASQYGPVVCQALDRGASQLANPVFYRQRA